jgi:hypothetical protein
MLSSHVNPSRRLTFENLCQDDRGWTCLFRAVDQGHLDIIKMLLRVSDCACAEKLLMLRDKVRNFKPIDDQGDYGYRALKHPFPQRDSIHHGMNSLELVNGFCF